MTDADVDGLAELVLLPEGAAFGSYVVHQCIGQGAMGNVYRAEHALLEKPVAIKVMDASLLSSADARERFLRGHDGTPCIVTSLPENFSAWRGHAR